MIKLTEDLIRAGESTKGGYNKKQLAILDVAWPPSKGWKSATIGKSIRKEDYQQFLDTKKI